jgi:hypothetical protein
MSVNPNKSYESTVIAIAEQSFLDRFSDARVLSIPGEMFGPAWAGRRVSLAEAKALLMGPAADACDRVWAVIAREARERGGDWSLAAAGMAAPMLKRTAAIASAKFDGMRADDLAAEIVAAFLSHLAVIDLERPGILVRMRWATWRATVKVALINVEAPVPNPTIGSMPPTVPCAHPDVALARAERAGIITAPEADLIGMTRLDEVTLIEAGACLGITPNAAKIRRQKAEARLVAFLTAQPIPARKDLKNVRARATARPTLAAT